MKKYILLDINYCYFCNKFNLYKMANGLNKVMLLGNLGKDPDVQIYDGTVKRAAFTLATSETYRDKEGNRTDKTEWHNVVVWRHLADIAEKYLHKGSKIYLEGKIKTRNYQDQTGNTRYITEIVGDTFIMLDRKENDGNAPVYDIPPQKETGKKVNPMDQIINDFPPEIPSEEGDDLPF